MIECFFGSSVVSSRERWHPHASRDNRWPCGHPPHTEGPGSPHPLPFLPEGAHCCRGWRAHQEGWCHYTGWRYKSSSLSQIWHVETRSRSIKNYVPLSECLAAPPANISLFVGEKSVNFSWVAKKRHRNVGFQIHYLNKNGIVSTLSA